MKWKYSQLPWNEMGLSLLRCGLCFVTHSLCSVARYFCLLSLSIVGRTPCCHSLLLSVARSADNPSYSHSPNSPRSVARSLVSVALARSLSLSLSVAPDRGCCALGSIRRCSARFRSDYYSLHFLCFFM